MKRLALCLVVLLAGCGESLEEMKSKREELTDRVAKARADIFALEWMIENGEHPVFSELFAEELKGKGYHNLKNERLDELAALEPRLEEICAKIDKRIRSR